MANYWLFSAFLLTAFFPCLQGQDIHTLTQLLNDAILNREFVQDYPMQVEEVVQDLLSLNKMWTGLIERTEVSVGAISEQCKEAAIQFTLNETDTLNLPLIVDLIDATGKLGAGVLDGNFILDGAYDQCLNLDAPVAYCVAPIHLGAPVPIKTGVCIPSACTVEDLATLIQHTLGNTSISTAEISCQTSKTKPYHWTAILMISFCCVLGTIIIVSTLTDMFIRLWKDRTIQDYAGMKVPHDAEIYSASGKDEIDSEDKPLLSKPTTPVKKLKKFDPVEWAEMFSLYKNISTILSTKQTSAAITSLNGIRVISMFWVILGHCHLVVSLFGVDNQGEIASVMGRFTFQAVGNAFFSVDSFFLLSGVLLAYLTLRQMKRKNGRFPYLMFYVHRYLRLTPVYAFLLFFTWFLGMHLADGPTFTFYDVGGGYWTNCNKYWWTNLLYINNLYPWSFGDSCMEWSWYLANDMQFFIISPLILIPMYFLFPLGLLIIGGLLFISFTATAVLAGVFDLQPSTFAQIAYHYIPPHNFSATLSSDLLYIKPWHRIQPYLVGLVLGYLLYRQIRVPFNRYIRLGSYLVMWGLAFIFCTSTLYGLYGVWHGHVPSVGENVMYFTFSRFTWGLGVALLVFICHNGYGGWVNSFLSMKVWIPLSRLTYNAYLVHPVVVTTVFGSARKSLHYTDINMAIYAIGCTVISFATAFIAAVCVEFPFGNLEMAFFKLFGVGTRESTRADTEAKTERINSGEEDEALLSVKKNYYSGTHGEATA